MSLAKPGASEKGTFTLENHTPKSYYFLILTAWVQVLGRKVLITVLRGGLFQPTNSVFGVFPSLEQSRFISQPVRSMFESGTEEMGLHGFC